MVRMVQEGLRPSAGRSAVDQLHNPIRSVHISAIPLRTSLPHLPHCFDKEVDLRNNAEKGIFGYNW